MSEFEAASWTLHEQRRYIAKLLAKGESGSLRQLTLWPVKISRTAWQWQVDDALYVDECHPAVPSSTGHTVEYEVGDPRDYVWKLRHRI